MLKEITAQELDTGQFIAEKVREIQEAVGQGTAINALSGGVDSSVVTMLGHALKSPARFVENGSWRGGGADRAHLPRPGVPIEGSMPVKSSFGTKGGPTRRSARRLRRRSTGVFGVLFARGRELCSREPSSPT